MPDKMRVLYAEDNPSDADLTRTYFNLHAPEFDLEIVDTGSDCLSRLRSGKYDALLLDNRLRDMDGIEVLRELAQSKTLLPVVMVTGVGDEELVVQVLRIGASDYVPKSGDYVQCLPAVLKTAIAEFRSRQERWGGPDPVQRHILYVESDSADADLTVKHFDEAAAHLRIEIAASAEAALARLSEFRFDLVLSDLRLPTMNALDLLRALKLRGLMLPCIVITGKGDEAAAAAALKLGAYDYIVKRENYLVQLPYAIDNAIARAQLVATNARLERELAERKRAEAENQRLLSEGLNQRHRLDEIIASVPGVVFESWGAPGSGNRKPGFVSPYVERLLGYSVQEWLSTPDFWLTIVHPEDRERAQREALELFERGLGGICSFRWVAKDGRILWVEARSTTILDDQGRPLGVRGVTTDVSASKDAEAARAQLELQLRQAQKLESIGRLAGGIAHDFNNLLTIINGYVDMIQQELEPADPLNLRLKEIRTAGERAAELTRQLLAFSRRQLLQHRVLDLNGLVEDSVKMLKRVLGEDIELITSLDATEAQVRTDAGQMHQVILNLAVNSRDAMPEGGKLRVETSNVVIDEQEARQFVALKPGAYVKLSVIDTGHGMDAEVLSHIFEPFFTTKEQGKGTGLGLSTVYGIVKQSGGAIRVSSEPDQGTTFEIFLPHAAEPVDVSEERTLLTPRGSETILVVEDEEPVRKLAAEVLRRSGYQVLEAANGGEALLVCEKHCEKILLMITDVVMPRMSGAELAARLRLLCPAMRVIFMSGYPDSAVTTPEISQGVSFLQKPFTPSALTQAVRKALNEPPPARVKGGAGT